MTAITTTMRSPDALPPAATSVAALYNTLPSVIDANNAFDDVRRQDVLQAIGEVLERFGNTFGVCLVHQHCELGENEVMISRGHISEPIDVKEQADTVYYPERWLADGRPYEFSSTPTEELPADLVEAFTAVAAPFLGILGMYYAAEHRNSDIVLLEHQEGRANVTVPISAHETREGTTLQTGWIPTRVAGGPITVACVIECDGITTRTGFHHNNNRDHRVKPDAR